MTATKAYGKETLTARLFFAIDKLWVYSAQDMASSFSDFFARFAAYRNLSLREMAKILGTNHGTLHAALSGKYPPPPKQLDQWSERLRLTPDDRAEMWMLALSAKAPDDIKTLCHELISLYRDVLRLKDERARTDLKLRAHLSPVAGRRVAEGPLDPDDWIDYGATLYDPEPPGASPAPGRSAAAPKRDDENGEA